MNAERLRRHMARLLMEEMYCIFCGERDHNFLVRHTGPKGNLFFCCVSCVEDIIERM